MTFLAITIGRRFSLFGGASLVAVGLSLVVWFAANSTERLLEKSNRAFVRGGYAEAGQLAGQVLAQQPRLAAALVLAARAAMKLGHDDEAAAYFGQIDAEDATVSPDALHDAGDVALRRGRARESEGYLRRALQRDPHHLPANLLLAYLLSVEGRSWEMAPFMMEVVRRGGFTREHLRLLGLNGFVTRDDPLIERCLKAVPDDPLPLLGRAKAAIFRQQAAEAEKLLRKIVAVDATQWEAQARLGEALMMQSSREAFVAWHARLPPEADGHPEIWMVRGLWARERGEANVAARCFWQAIKLDPNRLIANYQLGQVLSSLGRSDLASPFLQRADWIERLNWAIMSQGIADFESVPRDVVYVRTAAEKTESLGRLWEAWGWNEIALRLQPDSTELQMRSVRLEEKLNPDLPQTLASANPALSVDLSNYPLPRWRPQDRLDRPEGTEGREPARVTFADQAISAGINFSYFNHADPAHRITRMMEVDGGGVAVLDYDGDAWPDLYFTQGCVWPPQADQREHLDRLYRNLGNGQFEDVTDRAGLGDQGYSQGATVGDLDNDGWPDLYVANIGTNRLYRNNGDGTFSDIGDACGLQGRQWTSSCLIADLNGDTWPDIYDVNYVRNDRLIDAPCRSKDNYAACSLTRFKGAQDQLYLNLGDGRFQEATVSAGIGEPDGPDGKGLGIVAADFGGSGRLSLFVANDGVPNFYYVNQTKTRGGPLRFVESGMASGLALDWGGNAQACMGVAAGDANGDGRLDLFVTNFYNESNTLYLQQSGNFFVDATRRAGLEEPSFLMLGFGTQFIDGELDGKLDLVVANGHVFDSSHKKVPYQMPPQYFRNLGTGRFEELPGEGLGDYFQKKYLGRGLARLDWNRDGREDFAVSNINAPASLVTNQTVKPGHFIALQFRGVTSDRDAIGITVRLRAGKRLWVQQLTAGDGYQASNQRQLVFGLGTSDRIDELAVRWPSGLQQTFEAPPLDAELLIIEGRDIPLRIPSPR